jgi:tetratricopeptide (TPR) repeat protein
MKLDYLYLAGVVIVGLLIITSIIYFGFYSVLRIILALILLLIFSMSIFFCAVSIYVKSWKLTTVFGIFTLLSICALYLTIIWNPATLFGIILIMASLFLFGIWYISEPDIGLVDRFKNPKKLEKEGKYKEAAKKYEKNRDYLKTAKMYEKIGLLESATYYYEKCGEYGKAAEIYQELYNINGDIYYLKESYELWKSIGDLEKAVKSLEKYAKEEPWFWKDVAKHHEELGDRENAMKSWKMALDYYILKSEEEGAFWEDVANIYNKLGDLEKASDAWRKFLDYCFKEVKYDRMWWKPIAKTYECLGEGKKAEDAWKNYEEYRKLITKDDKV